ncbi:MAG: adenylosuccinate lyase [Bacteroidales bacterium]|nr:adenylosuccinate lyase [Bacteroidales bacterium]
MEENFKLWALSPIDGRYRNKTDNLKNYFSEAALIKYRLLVEVEYFISLCVYPLPQLDDFEFSNFEKLRAIYENFKTKDARRIKEIENTTNHDVKAVEYFLKEKFDELGFGKYKEFIHFGLTSQDINNTAVPVSMKDAYRNEIWPLIDEIQQKLYELSFAWKDIPMLARTHGQPASPTTVGKELFVFSDRLEQQINLLGAIPFSGKFGGATGNFNAHHAAYPNIDWVDFANAFLSTKLGLERQFVTTQIDQYDNLAAFFDAMKRINVILLDLNRDMWAYISMDYFGQKIKKGEVGSSAMPHKVNPIDFENSEGNLGIANAIFNHLSSKLPVSRLQRDLTDSTVLRNIGVPFAHSMIAYTSLLKGLDKIILNKDKLRIDLENNWAVVAEAIQTILRRENFPNPYEALKELTRTGEKITKQSIHLFINNLDVSEKVKNELLQITPHNYLGISPFVE